MTTVCVFWAQPGLFHEPVSTTESESDRSVLQNNDSKKHDLVCVRLFETDRENESKT